MEASNTAVRALMKAVHWLQPTCIIVMRQIFQCIGRLFHQIEQVDADNLGAYLEGCFKLPLAPLKQMQLDKLRTFIDYQNVAGVGLPCLYVYHCNNCLLLLLKTIRVFNRQKGPFQSFIEPFVYVCNP